MAIKDWFSKKKVKDSRALKNYTHNGSILLTNNTKLKYNFQKTSENLEAYFNIPQLKAVVDYSAKVFSRNILNYYNSNDEIKDNYLLDVLENPHPLYSEGEFWETFYKQWKLFGGVYVYKVQPVGMEVKRMYVLPTHLLKIKLKKINNVRIILNAKDINEIIDKYILTYNGYEYEFNPEEIWSFTDSSMRFQNNQYVIPDNPLKSIKYPLNNLFAQYKSRNTIVDRHGALGIITNEVTNEFGQVVPQEKEEINRVQNEFMTGYGLTDQDFSVLVTSAKLKWQSMNKPISQLQLFEGIQNDKMAVCDAYQFPVALLNDLQRATYNNLEQYDQDLYTKKIIPEWDMISKSMTREFLQEDDGGYYKFEIDQIETLQTDKEKETNIDISVSNEVRELNASVSRGEMSRESAISILINEFDMDEEKADSYISQPIQEEISQNIEIGGVTQEQLEAQANLRGTVGGVQGILAIQESVSQGITDIQAAINTLMEIYGFTEETAISILGTPNTNENGEAG
jgi:hypothetical protein